LGWRALSPELVEGSKGEPYPKLGEGVVPDRLRGAGRLDSARSALA